MTAPWPDAVIDAVCERVWDAISGEDRKEFPNLHTWQRLLADDREHCQRMAAKTRDAVSAMLDLIVLLISKDPRV